MLAAAPVKNNTSVTGVSTVALICTEGISVAFPPNAAEVSGALLERWEARYFWISMFLPHHHLDDVKERMVSLDSYAQTDEYAEWLEAHHQLHQSLTHIRGLLKADADNIL